jgi:hypothetical protein
MDKKKFIIGFTISPIIPHRITPQTEAKITLKQKVMKLPRPNKKETTEPNKALQTIPGLRPFMSDLERSAK